MEWLKELWDSLLDENHRGRLFGVITLLVGAVWGAYVHFSKRKGSSSTQVVNIGITLEEHDESLKRREQEIREELKEETKKDREKDQDRIQILEMQLNAVGQKRNNAEQDLEDHKKLLAETEQALARQPDLMSEELEQAKTALNKGNTDKAEELLEKVLQTEKQSIDRGAEASYQLGLLVKDRVDYGAAWQALTRAVEMAPDNSLYLSEAGVMAHTLGRYDTAIELFDKALAIDLKTHGPSHPNVATDWNNLGSAWQAKGEYDKAIENFDKALASDLKTLGPEHPNVAIRWNNLGGVLQERGKYDKAIEYFDKALASDLKTYGPEHPNVARELNNLGLAWYGKREYGKAIEHYDKALASDLKTFGPDHPAVAIRWTNLGNAWHGKGEHDKAIEYLEKALTSDLKTYGTEHLKVASVWNSLGCAWQAKGQYNKAIEYYEQALASDLKTFGPEHPNVAIRWNNLGSAWREKGDTGKAREYFNMALTVFQQAGLEHNAQVVEEHIRSLPPA